MQDVNVLKKANATYPIHELVAVRWSPRAFDPHPVEDEKLLSLFEAARWSASGGNGQPWSFVVARQATEPERFARLVRCLMEGNVPWASQAPVLVLSVAQTLREPGKPNRTALYDLGLAVQNLSLQATALGLYLHQMGGFSPDKARSEFNIPEGYDAVTMFAIGYRGDPALLNERAQAQELAPRTRKPLTDFVFGDQWGEVSSLVQP
jgi:nitroreductase